LIEADRNLLSKRVYNIQGLSFSCEELALEIKKRLPDFKYRYDPDFRDRIAKSWPEQLDDLYARKDWGWSPKCKTVEDLVDTMFATIKLTKY
jgi:threonine 3-dehydrogenase